MADKKVTRKYGTENRSQVELNIDLTSQSSVLSHRMLANN